jgi:hypothetical protein
MILKYNQTFRSNVEIMYLVYIRPLFEYAWDNVWDNYGIGYSDRLEKLQLDAARIVTGYLLSYFLNVHSILHFGRG